MTRVYWDTMLFVYWLEDHPVYASRVRQLFGKMEQRGDVLCTSIFTIGEVLVAPHRKGLPERVQQVREFFRTSVPDLLPLTEETANRYGQIRAANRVTPPDAIHLASAASAGVDLFLTNDRRLRGLVIPGIHFIAGMDSDIL
jgi:predicted nucleic acid-binding protein